MSEFLKKLKNAVETGEFNSDVAKKINEINEIADNIKIRSESDLIGLEDKLKKSYKTEPLNEEEKLKLTLKNEKFEEQIKEENKINILIASICNQKDQINMMIINHLNDLKDIEESYYNRLNENKIYEPLINYINKIKSQYKTFLETEV